MSIAIEKKLEAACSEVRQWTKTTYKKCQDLLKFKDADIDINQSDKPENLRSLNGIGGFCPSGLTVRITVDPKHPQFSKESFCLTLAHELSHLARRQAGIKIGESSLLECLISEGLADHFCFEVYRKTPIWVSKLNSKETQILLNKAESLLQTKVTKRLYSTWFLVGSPENNIPKWGGYSLGYSLVSWILKRKSVANSSALTKVPAEELAMQYFPPKWKLKLD